MKKIILLVAGIACAFIAIVYFLVKGTPSITNDEIIRETKKCEEAGMRAELFIAMYDNQAKRITCMPIHL